MANPKQLITKEFAIVLNQNYINLRTPIITAAIGGEDADAVWFSLEEMEEYLAFIKAEAIAKNATVDGIRLYLGVYPQESSYADKAGKTTIFLTPTGYENNNTPASRTAGVQSPDLSSIKPLNFGGMGTPPTLEYPKN